MPTAAILTAAGSGVRLGRSQPKALVEVAGAPMIMHAARNLARSDVVDMIVVTAPEQFVDQFENALTRDRLISVPITVIKGGGTRQESVNKALAELPPEADVVLVHDAARPFASANLVRDVVEHVQAGRRAVVPAVPVTDTIKQVSPITHAIGEPYRRENVARIVEDPDVERVAFSPPRDHLRAAQTPQGFDRRLLERAYAAASNYPLPTTDDAGLVEALGEVVVTIPGEESAAKITTERDLQVAELLFGAGLGDEGLAA